VSPAWLVWLLVEWRPRTTAYVAVVVTVLLVLELAR
jgi:hypothetical protein